MITAGTDFNEVFLALSGAYDALEMFALKGTVSAAEHAHDLIKKFDKQFLRHICIHDTNCQQHTPHQRELMSAASEYNNLLSDVQHYTGALAKIIAKIAEFRKCEEHGRHPVCRVPTL